MCSLLMIYLNQVYKHIKMKTIWIHNNNQITDCLKSRSKELYELETYNRTKMMDEPSSKDVDLKKDLQYEWIVPEKPESRMTRKEKIEA